jgi:hypothetical protein
MWCEKLPKPKAALYTTPLSGIFAKILDFGKGKNELTTPLWYTHTHACAFTPHC